MTSKPTRKELQTRLFKRDDDMQQALVRLILGSIVLTYLLIYYHHASDPDFALVVIAIIYFAIAVMIAASNFIVAGNLPIRRYIAMIADVSVISYALVLGGATTASFVGGYLWITIANGLRYGRSFLYLTGIFSVAGFVIAMWLSDFWLNHLALGLGLLLWLVLLPLYVSMLIKKYENAVNEAKKANEAKSQFLANMSHELRTPLNAIIGYSEMLHEEATEENRQESASDLEKVLYSANHLLNLINGILDISKIEAGRVDVQYSLVDLHAVLIQILDAFKPQLAKNNNTIALHYLSNEKLVYTDEEKLSQVMLNLLGNAVKFTHDGEIIVTVSTVNDGNIQSVQIDVEDTGIGIQEDKLESLFEPFVQADSSTTRKYGGTGLGLALSRCFVEMLGGTLTATSKLGEGSVFTMRLPVRKEINHKLQNNTTVTSARIVAQS